MKKICILLAVVLVIAFCGGAFAHGHHDDREARWCREEASRRNIILITPDEAKRIAEEHINERVLRFDDVDLEDEADDYPNDTGFRPVYSLECVCASGEYDVDIDAATGQVLKLKLDD